MNPTKASAASDPGLARTGDLRFRNAETAGGGSSPQRQDGTGGDANARTTPQGAHNGPASLSIAHRGVPLADRLWVRLSIEGECIVFGGALSSHGYGLIKDGSKPVRTHRVMWEMARGPIPEGLEVDHLCRNRRCCRLEHLELVTHAVNVRRAAESRRVERASLPYVLPVEVEG